MKAIVAFIKPHKLGDVTLALHGLDDMTGMTVTDVRGFGRTRAQGSEHVVTDEVADFVRKTRIDIVCSDPMVDTIVETIRRHAHTGAHGDGKIYVWDVAQAVRIRTGETNADAIQGIA
ncbi:MAG: P-II family nitrogen regulator [Candidatus Zixiibacteriota bacterium]